ncbi:MAG: PASTA domain-containing protein [Nitrospiraceae bacterium]|nr:MAG: PASTA domain-containing protein [Nitrospiraceae bacterium]
MRNVFRILFYFIGFVALGAAVAYLVFRIVDFDKTGVVPQLEGKSISGATELLKERKLLLSIGGTEATDAVPEDHVVRQTIKPGEKIRPGSTVEVTVSRPREVYSMPSFEGQLLDEAKLTLDNLGIRMRKVTWVHSDSVEKGRIIAQRPLSGNITVNEINLLASLGAYSLSYRCPSFVNMSIDDARELAAQMGITLVEKERGSKVIFQKPEAGAVIEKGGVVEVKLGRGWGMWF